MSPLLGWAQGQGGDSQSRAVQRWASGCRRRAHLKVQQDACDRLGVVSVPQHTVQLRYNCMRDAHFLYECPGEIQWQQGVK